MKTIKLDLSEPHQKYLNKAGDALVSCTGILSKHISHSALVKWAYNLGKTGKDLEIHGGEKRRIGSIFHFMTHGFLDSFQPDLSLCEKSEVESAEEMLGTFKKWWWKSGLDRVHTEIQLASDSLGYGGTIDLIARNKKGELVMIDFKTGSELRPQYELQMAGYKLLFEDCHPFDDCISEIRLLRIGYEGDIEERIFTDFTQQMKAWKAITHLHSVYKTIEDRQKGYKKVWPKKRKSK